MVAVVGVVAGVVFSVAGGADSGVVVGFDDVVVGIAVYFVAIC